MGLGLSAAFAIIVSGMLLASAIAFNAIENSSELLEDGKNDRHILTVEKQQTKVWIAYAIVLNNTIKLGLGDNITGMPLSILCFNTGSKSIDLKNAEFFINGNITNRIKSIRVLDGVGEIRVWNESGWLNSSLWAPDTGIKVFFDVDAKEGDVITVVTDNGISASGVASTGRLAVDIGPDIEIFEENTIDEDGSDHNGTITLSANISIRSVQTNLDWYNALKWSPNIEKIVNVEEYYKYAWDADAADGVDFENPSSTDSVFAVKLASRDLNGDGVIDPYIITVQVIDMITGETAQDGVRVLVRDCTPPKIKVVSNHVMAISDGKFAIINDAGNYVLPCPVFPQPISMAIILTQNYGDVYGLVDGSNPYYEVNESTEVTFNAAIDDTGEGIFTDNVAKQNQLRYAWDFDGDGKFDTNLSKDSLIVKHTFSNPLRNLTNNNDLEEANYTVKLYVVDPEGNWNTTSQKVRVLDNTSPIAYFDMYPTPVLEDTRTTFYGNLSTDNFCNATDLYYAWDLNSDGTTDFEGWGYTYSRIGGYHATPLVNYSIPGEYNVTLTVWDYRERQRTPIPAGHAYSRRIIVLDATPPIIMTATVNSQQTRWLNFTGSGGVTFDASVWDNSGGQIFWVLYYYYNNSLDYEWNEGVTESGRTISQSLKFYTIDSLSYTYSRGSYTAELRVWDEYGNANSYSWYISVT